MTIAALAKKLNIPLTTTAPLSQYNQLRRHYFQLSQQKRVNAFQSPTINPSAVQQRNNFQIELEHSVYQRADFTPTTTEKKFNSSYPTLGEHKPQTLFFNSGMASISSVYFYLTHFCRLRHFLIGENAYFETKWLADEYSNEQLFNEYSSIPSSKLEKCRVVWLEYPINCTNQLRYPISNQPLINEHIGQLFAEAQKNVSQHYALVIDYTLSEIPFSLLPKELPPNVSLFLITSLQKHRGYGLDLVNAGAVTFYTSNNQSYEELKKIRAITGTACPQETLWLQTPIRPRLINRLIHDSGRLAHQIFCQLKSTPLVTATYADTGDFNPSFIFLNINRKLVKSHTVKPYVSEQLVSELITAAKEHHTILLNGTSFGFPFSRVFKNSERYQNADSLRIAIGYDETLHKHMATVINLALQRFTDTLH